MWPIAKVILMFVGVATLMWIYTNLAYQLPSKIARTSVKHGVAWAHLSILVLSTANVVASFGMFLLAAISVRAVYGNWGVYVVFVLWVIAFLGGYFYFRPATDIHDIDAMIHSRDLNKRR